jgi:hypothetical protein
MASGDLPVEVSAAVKAHRPYEVGDQQGLDDHGECDACPGDLGPSPNDCLERMHGASISVAPIGETRFSVCVEGRTTGMARARLAALVALASCVLLLAGCKGGNVTTFRLHSRLRYEWRLGLRGRNRLPLPTPELPKAEAHSRPRVPTPEPAGLIPRHPG